MKLSKVRRAPLAPIHVFVDLPLCMCQKRLAEYSCSTCQRPLCTQCFFDHSVKHQTVALKTAKPDETRTRAQKVTRRIYQQAVRTHPFVCALSDCFGSVHLYDLTDKLCYFVKVKKLRHTEHYSCIKVLTHVYITGGLTNAQASHDFYVINLLEDYREVHPLSPMPFGKAQHYTLSLVDRYLYPIGGIDCNRCAKYDIPTRRWHIVPSPGLQDTSMVFQKQGERYIYGLYCTQKHDVSMARLDTGDEERGWEHSSVLGLQLQGMMQHSAMGEGSNTSMILFTRNRFYALTTSGRSEVLYSGDMSFHTNCISKSLVVCKSFIWWFSEFEKGLCYYNPHTRQERLFHKDLPRTSINNTRSK